MKRSKTLHFFTFALSCVFSLVLFTQNVFGQYQMEKLNRGVVAVRTGANNFVSWRFLGNEDDNVTFNLYRGATKVNATPLNVTNYTDNGAAANSTYAVRAIINGTEQPLSETASVWGQQYLTVPLQIPAGGTTPAAEAYTYSASDCSIGDVDGDGEATNGERNDYNYENNIIQRVQNEIELLAQNAKEEDNAVLHNTNDNKFPTTTLIVCPECYPNDFISYLNIVHEIEDMIEDNDAYDGIVQLASFHPQYCFDGSSSANDDPDNCTNQSPYPTFHLLREMDVSHVVDTLLPNQDSSIVWSRNVDLLRTLHDELSETEFTSVLKIPPPPSSDTTTTPTLIKSTPKKDLIFRVRQILRRFPITLLRSNNDK